MPKTKTTQSEEQKTGLTEDSIAMASLHPAARPVKDDPKSKLEYMEKMLSAMGGMDKVEIHDWFEKAIALIGKEARNLPGGADAAANQGSVKMHPGSHAVSDGSALPAMPMVKLDHKNNPLAAGMKEAVEEMLEGQELSEEFKTKASTLFEAAINSRIATEVARLEEEYETKYHAEVTEAVGKIEERVDAYATFVAEKYGSSTSPVLARTSGSAPSATRRSQCAAPRRSCHTMAL